MNGLDALYEFAPQDVIAERRRGRQHRRRRSLARRKKSGPHFEFSVSDKIDAQVDFWADPARVRGFVGGLGSGKTFAGAIEILRQPGKTRGLVVSPTYAMMRDTTQATFFEIAPRALILSHNKSDQHTKLRNGTEILWRSADRPNRLRGVNAGWAWGDEWAYVDEEAHKTLLGRLRKGGGRFWFTTTPNGQNWLYHWAVLRDLSYSLHHAHTADNPFNAEDYATDLAKAYAETPLFAAQELAGQWVDISGTKRFPGTLVDAVYAHQSTLALPSLPPITGDKGLTYSLPDTARMYARPRSGRDYRIGADCAEGLLEGDDSTVVVVDRVTGEVVCVAAGEWEPQEEHGAIIAMLSRYYNRAPALVERNNHGHAVLGSLHRLGVDVLRGHDDREGWSTSAASKAELFSSALKSLKVARADEQIVFHDGRLKEQIKSIDRSTLRGPGKGRRKKVDDEALAWVLADKAREDSSWLFV